MTLLSTRFGHTPVIRITLPYLFDLANSLEPLANIRAESSRLDTIVKIWGAQAKLSEFLSASVFSSEIRSSRKLGEALLVALGNFKYDDINAPLDLGEAYSVTYPYSQFKIALLAELGIAPAYFVSQKGGYSTLSLLDDPASLYPLDIINKVPEAIFDVAEAGKALAFELATACGFHAFRATESVIRRYYAEVTSGAAPPRVRSIIIYAKAMRNAQCGDSVILTTLEQMAALHRNPLIHPEAVLTIDEAISILGISRSVVTAMLAVLPVQPPTTTTLQKAF